MVSDIMCIYRVVDKEQYINGNILNKAWDGVNTFKYDENKEYVHFFILP